MKKQGVNIVTSREFLALDNLNDFEEAIKEEIEELNRQGKRVIGISQSQTNSFFCASLLWEEE